MLTVHSLPTDYRWATGYEVEFSDNLIDPVEVKVDWGIDLAVPAAYPVPCVREFGPHDDCTGTDECPAMETLYLMNAPMPDDYLAYDYPSYDPQTDHYERFGRPAFPNEY